MTVSHYEVIRLPYHVMPNPSRHQMMVLPDHVNVMTGPILAVQLQ